MGTFNAGLPAYSPIFSEIDVAAYGKLFSDGTYGHIIGERKSANFTWKSRNRPDWIKRPQVDMIDVEVDVDLYENDLQTLYNWMLLAKQTTSGNNWRFKLPGGKYINLVENTGNDLTNPAGSTLLNHTLQFVCGDKERSIKIKAMGGMYRPEFKWLVDNAGSGATGGASGANISGMTHMAYDQDAVGAPGILSVDADGDYLLTPEESSTITLDFTQQGITSPRHQPILGLLEIKAEIMVWNSDIDQTEAAVEAYLNDDIPCTIQLPPTPGDITNTRGNMKIVLNSSAFLDPSVSFQETSKFTTKLTLAGAVPFDSPGWAGNNVNFNIASNTLTLNRIGTA